MALACRFGAHRWKGCRCTACGRVRESGHGWQGCKCSGCGQVRQQEHDWRRDCELCARCGTQRQGHHQWQGCQCQICYSNRDEEHDWSRNCNFCARCGRHREAEHLWAGCGCQLCATTRDTEHHFNGCICTLCGRMRDEQHDWSQNCQRCALCGRSRFAVHQWADEEGPCLRCGAENPEPYFEQGNLYFLEVLESCSREEALQIASEALREYRKAAEAGHPLAMNMLALLVVETGGNLEEARRWLIEASGCGEYEISENLRNLRRCMSLAHEYTEAHFRYTWGARPPRQGGLPVGSIRPAGPWAERGTSCQPHDRRAGDARRSQKS